ncbi:MAG: UDP-GlcNAc:undecaprenyl-phosphate/decaprenyl-phosphate GlcNAc-phosphate transferase [Actinomycetota bacterium]|jgi:UDP-N-acetylmuramyl pentapeptide phosphotransferase/UDP-N-acetylglucosamine-1-phosphate transferase|nr:UDP-GlcNAc:undecaprenyl-phosphate/decaprenyl-phosphate GlcNAc-phosphate transferase [Actinomycetota bacterium]
MADSWTIMAIALLAGAVDGAVVGMIAIRLAPARIQRTNVDGKKVPAVLGWAIVSGGVTGLLVLVPWLSSMNDCDDTGMCLAPDRWLPLRVVGILLVAMFLVGLWDDLKGDERPRGFAGHLEALRGGALTGGMVKLIGGGLAGLASIYLLDDLVDVPLLLLGGACIALSANLFNLLDRAPGRASKVWLIVAVVVASQSPDWRLWAAGTAGAVIATLPLDLRAVGMLGDAGANPMGAVLGLGLVMGSGSLAALGVIVAVLLGLNLLSEKVSFSKVVEQTPWLARLDHLGRK